MSVDQYKLCPCGNGKKLKFCKCIDQPQEYEKISRMMEAEQELAALDRINQLLAKTPNSAWLLALKCELAITLDEWETFRETAVRFLKLKPDNPLALILRSVVACMSNEPLEVAAKYLLEGLAEFRERIHHLALHAINTLTVTMLRRGKGAYCSFWEDILAGFAESAEMNYEPNSSEADVNLLVKSPNVIIPDSPHSPWIERLNEVVALAQTFRYAQAETKLRAILRDFPDQPGPLSNLLRAQIILIDEQGAINTARKLASLKELPEATRSYFCALAMELEGQNSPLVNKFHHKYCEIDSVDEVVNRLRNVLSLQEVDSNGSAPMRQFYAATVNDEIPAQRMFVILSGDAKEGEQNSGRYLSGNVILLGKQTDKPARALVLVYRFPGSDDLFGRTVGSLSAIRDIEDPTPRTYPYTLFLERIGSAQATISDVPEESFNNSQAFIDEFLNMPMDMFGGDSPLQAAQDESKRALLGGLLAHFEGCQMIVVEQDTLETLYQRLGFERPKITFEPGAENLRINSPLDIDRIDASQLTDTQIAGLFVHASELGATRVAFRAGRECLNRKTLDDNHALRVRVISTMLGVFRSPGKVLELLESLQLSLAELNRPVGHVVIQRANFLSSIGKHDEARQMMIKAFADYPGDPYLLNFYQHVLQNSGAANDVDMTTGQQLQMRQARMRADSISSGTQAPSGLVLPGGDAGQANAGKSKLWLPGS